MSHGLDYPSLPSTPGQPTWEMADMFPYQGDWSVDEYVLLHTNRRIEFSNGTLEFLPMPTTFHEAIVAFLYEALLLFARPRNLGSVFFAGIKIHIEADKYRIPDIVFLSAQNRHLLGNKYWKGADIAMEVVSEDDPNRDLVTKRAEYAQAGIPEYWIVDPQQSAITVLKLDGTTYAEHGCFKPGERAASVLLPGFEVDVASAFEAGRKALG